MTTLFGWGPMFGVRGPSPTVMKCEIQLQMLGVRFDRKIADLESVSKHKAPYVHLDDGTVLQDSTFIRFHFEKALGVDLDEGLTDEQRAAAWGLERLLEDRLLFIMAHERWLEPDNFQRGPALFFNGVPEAARAQVIEQVLSDQKKGMHSHGVGRHSRDERMELARRDIGAIAAQLGDKSFLFGAEPKAVDASAFGVLSGCRSPIFDTPLLAILGDQPKVLAYLDRIEKRYFKDGDWPKMG